MSNVIKKKSSTEGTSSSKKRRGGRIAVRLLPHATEPGPASPAKLARRPRGADIRERILSVALEYFGTFGFEGTSTRAVAERANVTHTLILYHFRSKDQLWIATVEEALKSYRDATKANLESSHQRSAKDALATFIEQFVRMSADHPQIHRLMTMGSSQDTKRLGWIIDTFVRGHFTFVRDLIRRGQAEGSVRECDPARLYYLIIGTGGTPFTVKTEYKALTGRDVFSEAEILRNIAFIYEIIFV